MEYRCIVCGRVFPSGPSLRAHLKAHKGELCTFTVRVPRNLREDFKHLCHAHGVTTCHVIVSLMHAAVEGFRRGVSFEWDPRTESVRMKSGQNPIIVNFYQTFGGPPRSALKYPAVERVHEVELPCEVCGGPAAALHSKRLEAGWTHVAVCEQHHREALRSFYGDAWIPLDRVEVRKVG